MGRELRMVPPDWEHPKDERGRYIPLHKDFIKSITNWATDKAQWDRGFVREYSKDGDTWGPRAECKYAKDCNSFEDWTGAEPRPSDYMPAWPEEFCTHLQMYEDTSEGTPISPICETPEELARWLADNNASAFGSETATYEQWLATIKRGWAPSAMLAGQHLMSGVAATETLDRKP